MKILALELSTTRGSLAFRDDAMPGQSGMNGLDWTNERKDSGVFFQNLERTVEQLGLPEKIVVGLGPGSYAGVRIAISAAMGLSAAANAPLVGYPSICALPNAASEYAVVGDARRHSFFFVRVNNRTVADDYELLGEAELKERLEQLDPVIPVFSSDWLPQFQPRVEQKCPSAEILAQLAIENDRDFFQPPLEPIYLREANVTIPKPMLKRIRQ